MNESDRKHKITLEDLLKIKRSERPPAEFWPQFEQALRVKQLAAIVETRPWWRSLPTKKALIRLCVPLGAAAVVAMTFSSIRGFGTHSSAGLAANRSVTLQPLKAGGSPVTVLSEIDSHSATVAATSLNEAGARDVPPVAQAPKSGQLVQAAGESPASSPTQLLLASSPTVKIAGQALAQLVNFAESMPAQVGNSRSTVVEPLTQVATPRDNRRTRLLAYSVAFDPHAADSSDAARSRERITRRISDDSVYDSISRLGLSGDRVSIKF